MARLAGRDPARDEVRGPQRTGQQAVQRAALERRIVQAYDL
jgi:hypothetical protein